MRVLAQEIFLPGVDVEESEELLKQFVQDALLLKSSGSGTTLYDQYVWSLCLCVVGLLVKTIFVT